MKKKKYSLYSNSKFLLKELFCYQPSAKFWLPLLIIVFPLQNILEILIPSRAVYVIENQLGAEQFLLQVGGVIVCHTTMVLLRWQAQRQYHDAGVMTRVYSLMGKMVIKSLQTDYCNRESHRNVRKIDQANASLNGNFVGVEMVIKQFPLVAINFIGLILYGGAILTVDIRILLVLLGMLAANVLANRYARKYLEEHREEDDIRSTKFYVLQKKVSDIVYGKDIRMYRMEKWFGKVMQSYIDAGLRWQKGIERHFYLPVLSDSVFIALRDGLTYAILIHKVAAGEITLANFTFMIGVVAGFSGCLFDFVSSLMELLNANQSVSHFREVMDMEDCFLHGTGKKTGERELCSPPEIELRHVSFRYKEEEGETKEVLSDISLKLHAGEKIALVGGNGEGKTTLVKLLCGFYQPTEGQILINGVDLREYDIEEYFKMLGVVFQDVEALPYQIVSLVSNQEKEKTDMGRFWNAVKRAGLYEKLMDLSQKEDTYISNIFDDNGILLSGGEMQKLMLARCIYKDAPFLILDEPTSALDPLAESAMYEEYDKLTAGKTSIFISHRLASTRFCDRVLFLENGKIAEEGTHEELLLQKGRYAKIYEIQSHYYKEDAECTADRNIMEASYE